MPSFTDLSRGDLVEVLWNDAWFDLGEYVEGEFLSSWPRFLLGYFIAIDDGHAVFAMDYSCRDDTFSATASIPVAWVTGVRKLGSLGGAAEPEAQVPAAVPPIVVKPYVYDKEIARVDTGYVSDLVVSATLTSGDLARMRGHLKDQEILTTAYEASSARS